MEAILLIASVFAGFIGSLTGLGGGIIVVPFLVLGFGIDLRYAVGVSLVCVIATSSGAAIAYVREGYTNIRIGLFLEIATTLGALSGAFIAAYVSKSLIGGIFAIMLLLAAYWSTVPKPAEVTAVEPDWWARTFRLGGSYPDEGKLHAYNVKNVPGGFALMYLAGVLSALLGIGSGALKVVAMDNLMKLPFKVSTTTSNFMIGVTAAASAGVYLGRGYIDPTLAMPVMLGILTGSIAGARVLPHISTVILRRVFFAILVLLAVEMIFKSLTGEL
jgi:uncharacterized protein